MNLSKQQWKDLIDDMRDDPDYEFADDTLKSIREFAEKNGEITQGQQNAVENILNSKEYSETYNNWRDV